MKHGVSRRSVLKGACILAGVAIVPVGYSIFGRSDGDLRAAGGSWILATNQVARDAREFVALVADAIDLAPNRLMSASHVVPCEGNVRQDLTLVQNGLVRDLSIAGQGYPEMQALMTSLRERRDVATHFVHVYEAADLPNATSSKPVEFYVDGHLVESVPVGKNYKNISIAGKMGVTQFCYEDNALAVAKSSCRHKTCERMEAQTVGSIVCAPNRLVARLPMKRTVDAITA